MNEILIQVCLHEQRSHFASLLSKGSSLMILAAGIIVKRFKFRLKIAGPTIDGSGCDGTSLTENIPT